MKDFIATPDDYANDSYSDDTNRGNNRSQDERDNSSEIFYKELPQSRQQSDTVFCKVNIGSINKQLAKSLAKRHGLHTSQGNYPKAPLRGTPTFKMKRLDRQQDDDC